MAKKEKYLVSPDINNKSLITKLNGFDEKGNKIISKVINEKALTIFLNNQEIVTLMSISDHPKYLAVGYLLNQNMLKKNDIISKVEIDKDLGVVVVRTKRKTNYENKLKKKITTSGCAIGTVYSLRLCPTGREPCAPCACAPPAQCLQVTGEVLGVRRE